MTAAVLVERDGTVHAFVHEGGGNFVQVAASDAPLDEALLQEMLELSGVEE